MKQDEEERENYFTMRDKLEQEGVLNEMKKADRELGRLIKKCKKLNENDRRQVLKSAEPLLLKIRLKILHLKGKPIIEV